MIVIGQSYALDELKEMIPLTLQSKIVFILNEDGTYLVTLKEGGN